MTNGAQSSSEVTDYQGFLQVTPARQLVGKHLVERTVFSVLREQPDVHLSGESVLSQHPRSPQVLSHENCLHPIHVLVPPYRRLQEAARLLTS